MSRIVRAAVLVSGGGTNLQALLDAQSRGELGSAAVSLVVTNRKGAYALERAANASVPTKVVSNAAHPDPDERDEALLSVLSEHSIDIIALGGYLGILGNRVLGAYKGKIINIHPSLIPSFCGMGYYGIKVHEAAIARGVKITGATAFIVDEVVDGGPILLQSATEVEATDTPVSLQLKVMERCERIIFPKAVRMLADSFI